jgi:hypothetical protein
MLGLSLIGMNPYLAAKLGTRQKTGWGLLTSVMKKEKIKLELLKLRI